MRSEAQEEAIHNAARALKMPGRVYRTLHARATWHLDHDSDLDLCDAVSRARVRARGGGFTAYVPLQVEQVDRLSYWITDQDPKMLRDYRDLMRQVVELYT